MMWFQCEFQELTSNRAHIPHTINMFWMHTKSMGDCRSCDLWRFCGGWKLSDLSIFSVVHACFNAFEKLIIQYLIIFQQDDSVAHVETLKASEIVIDSTQTRHSQPSIWHVGSFYYTKSRQQHHMGVLAQHEDMQFSKGSEHDVIARNEQVMMLYITCNPAKWVHPQNHTDTVTPDKADVHGVTVLEWNHMCAVVYARISAARWIP